MIFKSQMSVSLSEKKADSSFRFLNASDYSSMDYYKTMDDFSCKYTNNETVFDLKKLSQADRDEVAEDMQDWETYMYCKEAQERLRASVEDFPPVRPSGDLFAENVIYFRVIDEQSKTKSIALGYIGSSYSNEETYYSNVPNMSSIDISNGENWDEELDDKKREEMLNLAKIRKARGNEAYKAQDFKKACELYSDCISCGDRDISLTAFNNRAQANMKMGNFTVAISDLNEVLETDPKNIKALFRRATCRKEMKMYREALKDLDILSDPQNKDSSGKKLRAEIEEIVSTLKGKSYRLRENSGYRETFQVDESQLPAYAEANKDCLDYLIEIDRNGCIKKCVCNHCTYEDQSRLQGNNRLRIERPKWKPLTSKLLEDMDIGQKHTANSSSDNDASAGDSKAINAAPKDDCDSSMNALKISSATIVNGMSRTTNVIQNHQKTPSVTNEMKELQECLRKGINLSSTSKIAEKNDVDEIKRINLKKTQPLSMKEVYGDSLNESILTSMMNSICRDFTFDNEWQLMAEYLEELARLKSFTTFINLVDKRTRGDVLNMLESASNLNLKNADNLKKLYSS